MVVVDILGEFLIEDMEKEVNIVLRRRLAELIMDVEPSLYRNHVTVENGQKLLYVRLQKEIYGTLKAALLFYKKLMGDMQSQPI